LLADGAYISTAEGTAHCSPALDLSLITGTQKMILLGHTATAIEWDSLIKEISAGTLPEWLQPKEQVTVVESAEDSFELLSPRGSAEKQGIFEKVPNWSFDSGISTESKGSEDLGDPLKQVNKLNRKFMSLKGKLARPFVDIEASYLALIQDVRNVNERVKILHLQIGKTVPVLGRSHDSVWSAIAEMSNEVDALEGNVQEVTLGFDQIEEGARSNAVEIALIKNELALLHEDWVKQGEWMKSIDAAMGVFQKRFGQIKRFIMPSNIPLNATNTPGSPNSGNRLSLQALEQRVQALESKLQGSGTEESSLRDIEEKIRILENRVVGAGVQMGGCVFQSFEDLMTWVQVKFPRGRFGFIVDGHSFLEFFTLSGHTETEAGTAAFNHSQNAGFTTYVEAQLAISFKNLFPLVFGKGGSANTDDSECLPGISTGDKWNTGSTGLAHQLMRNMNDVSYQLDSSIKKIFKDYPEAQQMAIDCVTASKRFVIDLIAFMSQEYATWQQRGFIKKDAWLIVSQIVRRIFEDLQSARISARNMHDMEDVDFITSSFIYATLKCHEVMETYVKHQFHAHPHVSSVITRHLAANFVKPESSLEAKVKALATKVDSHKSKIKLMVEKVKKGRVKDDQSAS